MYYVLKSLYDDRNVYVSSPQLTLQFSEFKNSIGGTLDYFKKLVLVCEIEKNGPPIFCLKEQPAMFLFRQDLKEKIEQLGLTGFIFQVSYEYMSLDPNE